MKTSMIAAAVLVPAVLLAGAAAALEGAPATSERAAAPGGPMLGRLADTPLGRLVVGRVGRLLALRSKLDLTDEQRRQIGQVLQSHRRQIGLALQPVVAKRRALREAVAAETPDEKAIRAAAAELGQAVGDAAVLAAKVRAEVRGILTPEQIKLIEAARTEGHEDVDRFLQRLTEEK